VILLRRSFDPSAVLAAASGAAITYEEVGATITGAMPVGYHHDRHRLALGHGDTLFGQAAAGLRQWQAHRAIGATVTPTDPPTVGTTVIVTLVVGPLALVAPCRVVALIEEDDRYGFAYGSLPGHPEQGEEAFVVNRRDGGVDFEVSAFSRPAELLPKLGGPVTRAVQRRATKGYLDGLQRWVAREV
jgi:uncharacterized protein (UPF0548 family)